MTRNDLRDAWQRIRHRRIAEFSPTPTEQAGALLFGQMLPLWRAIEVCDECRGPFWAEVGVVLRGIGGGGIPLPLAIEGAPMTYTIEHRFDRSGWTPRERFAADDDLEAIGVLEAEIARTPLDFLRLVEVFNFDGLRCGRVVREHVEGDR